MTSAARDVAPPISAIRSAAAGDTIAFARIVAADHADMVRVAYVVSGGNQELADDAVQAAWTIAWRKLGSLRDPERLKPWLVSVAANEARQLCRRQRRVAVVEINMRVPDLAESDPADTAEALDLERTIGHLGADDRALLALRYEAGLDSSEIGIGPLRSSPGGGGPRLRWPRRHTVDPMAMVGRSIGRRRFASLPWVGRTVPVPVWLVLVLGLLLAVLVGSAILVGSMWERQSAIIPAPSPTASALASDEGSGVLATTRAHAIPTAATCPPGSHPDAAGPIDQARPPASMTAAHGTGTAARPWWLLEPLRGASPAP